MTSSHTSPNKKLHPTRWGFGVASSLMARILLRFVRVHPPPHRVGELGRSAQKQSPSSEFQKP